MMPASHPPRQASACDSPRLFARRESSGELPREGRGPMCDEPRPPSMVERCRDHVFLFFARAGGSCGLVGWGLMSIGPARGFPEYFGFTHWPGALLLGSGSVPAGPVHCSGPRRLGPVSIPLEVPIVRPVSRPRPGPDGEEPV
jgi:hypothetical protein